MAEGVPARVVRVLPDVSALRKVFDYRVPPHLDAAVRVGTQVRVVLHGRRIPAWVVADDVTPAPDVTLRPLVSVRGWGPPPGVLELVMWAAWRWAGPAPSFLRTASAPRAVRTLPAVPAVRARARARATGSDRPAPAGPGAARYTGGAPAGDAEAAVAGALAGGVTVVRLGPASRPDALVDAAAARLGGAPRQSSVLVLAPAHREAEAVAARLRRRELPVALLPGDWAAARAGGHVVIGTRAGAFAPADRLAAAVVLDAHDEAYHEERAPTWAAWAVVAERARRDGAPCALVSPCPTLELLASGRLVTVPRAAERRGWPAVEVVDRRADDPRTGMFSERLVRLVRWAGAATGRRVVCVVNRTGRVRMLACAACGELARCHDCGAAVELVTDEVEGAGALRAPAARRGSEAARSPRLRCRRCGATRPVVCESCGATRTRTLRVGVTRVAEELRALTGGRVSEVWGAPARDDSAALAVAPVVVGTEAALHRVSGADAVAFLEFDAELLAPRFRAAEQALALLARAARLVAGAGGAGTGDRAPGIVVVQTRQPRHPALAAAVGADPGLLAATEHEVRAALRLPPVSALAVVSGEAADSYGSALRAAAPKGVEVAGPVAGAWSLRAPDHAALCDLLAAVPRPPGRLRVEVDPVRV